MTAPHSPTVPRGLHVWPADPALEHISVEEAMHHGVLALPPPSLPSETLH